ncbi:MGMT family protein [Candidatus Gracilibacteria bacterium]|jgi:O-6-methylguanine DNA methyltransferase|nr:MGMT family protein [Candidatus Gracilibacteria bacterium]
MEFKARILNIVSKIPKGQLMTYSQVASLAGNPKAARVVGQIMSKNYDNKIPCHRVIGKNLKLTGYNRGGVVAKAEILKTEGVNINDLTSFLVPTSKNHKAHPENSWESHQQFSPI